MSEIPYPLRTSSIVEESFELDILSEIIRQLPKRIDMLALVIFQPPRVSNLQFNQ